ncbi:MAG: hypothetical protein R3F41_11570 [Gammaproteobacteria bacterium]|nr:hypothetical protein [Pseudomonadales bacterium]MCP5348251.1 hypothetical protein [Pseudomonadales bacterium]
MDDIPLLALIFGFVAFCVYMDYRVKVLKVRAGSNSTELQAVNEKLESKTRELEERVRVLESIVTDRRHRLQEEIDTLQ